MQVGAQHTRGPWSPSDWKDDEAWLAQRAEFTRAGGGVPDDFARYSSRYRGYTGEQSGWPREWPHGDDAAYAQWREEELGKFDEDYAAWRSERYRKFSQQFDAWRRERASGAGAVRE